MRKGGSNPKGGAFERKIALLLSEWMSEGEYKDWFWRTAMSGGRSTVFAKRGISLKNQVGDICAIDENSFKFSKTFMIECKNYKNIHLHNFITGAHNHVTEWWHDLAEKSDDVDKSPLLIMKQNQWPELIMMHHATVRLFRINRNKVPLDVMVAWYPDYGAYLFKLRPFLEIVNPNRVRYNND